MNTQAVAVLAVFFFCSQISLLIVTVFPACTLVGAKEKRVGKKDLINDK